MDVGMNGIDASTGSKVLVSSRVRGVLDGCAITDVGLPSKEEAIQMLMTGSGLSSDSAAPPEAAEVVRFCNHLPLAIAIAGRLLREIDVASGGWSGVVEMLSEEFASIGGQRRSMEESVISASIRGIRGPQRENILALFRCFALLPEDAHCSLSALRMLFDAATAAKAEDVGGSSEIASVKLQPTILDIRRWLKVLLDRALVLGSVDKPSLHVRNPPPSIPPRLPPPHHPPAPK